MIDLTKVADEIAALDGWTVCDMSPGDEWIGIARLGLSVSVFADGDVLDDLCEGDMMPLLPVLQIVARARGDAQ